VGGKRERELEIFRSDEKGEEGRMHGSGTLFKKGVRPFSRGGTEVRENVGKTIGLEKRLLQFAGKRARPRSHYRREKSG